MNIRRTISLFVLLLANVIMLAKPVVCYLQHNSIIPVTVCSTNQKHNCSKHAKQHNYPGTKQEKKCCDTERCFLHNLSLQESSVKLPGLSSNDVDVSISDIPVYRTIQITELTGLPFRQKPYIPLFYAHFVSQSIGLRAPPAC